MNGKLTAAEQISWADTCALIRSDINRLAAHLDQPHSFGHKAYFFFFPGLQVLFWHRISRYLLLRGWPIAARLVALFALYLTRAEIPPTTSIGSSALISHPTGVHLFGSIGARFTVNGAGVIGGGFDSDDIGGGPGYPLVGDDVVLCFGAHVLGSVRIGDGAKIGPCALVTYDVPPRSLVLWPKSRMIEGAAGPPQAVSSSEP